MKKSTYSSSPQFHTNVLKMAWFCLSLLAASLTGCGVASLQPASSPVSIGQIQGSVHGGQQPVSGSTINLYAAGTSGYGAGATSLLTTTVKTDANGNFNITGDYDLAACQSANDLVYIVATGGNPLAATANNSLALMAALGPCGNINSSTHIIINEVTTVAAVYALAPFMTATFGTAGAESISPSSTNITGLTNAFATVNNLVNYSTGTSPGPSAPLGSVIPSGLINSMANTLASCVNSDGTGCTASGRLFPAVTPSGSTPPADTIQAMLYVAQNPANNVAAIFNLGPAAAVFVGLATAPNDLTAEIAYNGSNAGGASLNIPFALSIDSKGDVWVINNPFTPSSTTPSNPSSGGNFVAELSNNGTLLSPTAGYLASSPTFTYPRGIAVDLNDTAWISNDGTVTGLTSTNVTVGPANSNLLFSITSSGVTGSVQTGTTSGTALDQPYGIAVDASNNVYFSSQALQQVGVLASGASSVTFPAAGTSTTTATPFPPAVDTSGNIWAVGDSSTGGVSYTVSPLGGSSSAGMTTTITKSPLNGALYSVAIDGSNNAWVDTATKLVNVTSSGTEKETCSSSTTLTAGRFLAVDGAGNIWISNLKNPGWVVEFSPTCTLLSGSTGLGAGSASQASLMQNPRSLAVDSSGNVWVANNLTGASGSTTIVEIVGVAAPTITPVALALKQQKVGQRP